MSVGVVIEVTRDGVVESRHRGQVAVVDAGGRLRAHFGDVRTVILARSSAKPLQAIAVVASGAAERFGFSERHLAVMCGSHHGQAVHRQTVSEILDLIGLGPASLCCGVHPPANSEARKQLFGDGKEPDVLHNNCSGKHAGMLAISRVRGVDPAEYFRERHPVQVEVAQVVASMVGMDAGDLILATDGCGVPSFGLPLERLAYGFARLAVPTGLSGDLADGARRIAKAMTAEPLLVAGTGAFDTELMSAGAGGIVSKSGAEAVGCVGVVGAGLGIALKIEDGGSRAVAPTMMAVLSQLGLTPGLEHTLSRFARPPVMNARRESVGELRPAFRLEGV